MIEPGCNCAALRMLLLIRERSATCAQGKWTRLEGTMYAESHVCQKERKQSQECWRQPAGVPQSLTADAPQIAAKTTEHSGVECKGSCSYCTACTVLHSKAKEVLVHLGGS